MLNRCEFIGNLGKDPEGKTLTSGGRVVSFTIAISEKWTDKNGERKEKTTWVPVVIWNEKLGEIAERYLTKGSKVYIAGAFVHRKYAADSGIEKYTTEIVLQKFRGELVLLDGRREAGPASAPAASNAPFDDDIGF